VDGKRLGRSWAQAASDPAQAMVLLTLGTLETYMRWLERQKTPRTDGADLTRPRAVDDSRSAPEGEPLCACS